MGHFISGMIVGFIILQTAVLAPTIFKTLEMPAAGALLRALFPKFFVLIALLGAGLLTAVVMESKPTTTALSIGITSLVSPLICRLMIPATNRARDAGNERRFKYLHMLSVSLTLLVLFGNLALLFSGLTET